VSGRSLIRPTGGAHVAHCISNSSGRQIERVSRNERPLWVDLSQPIVGAGTAEIGAKASSDKRQRGSARHRSGLVKGDVAALRLAEPPRWHY
jgi:hypothetical protein